MNHFRVRILDAARSVVFEQVIDQAPNPSREIPVRSLLARTTASKGGGQSLWSLRLNRDAGIDPGSRFRLSISDDPRAFEQERIRVF
jgi:hypothetical protein